MHCVNSIQRVRRHRVRAQFARLCHVHHRPYNLSMAAFHPFRSQLHAYANTHRPMAMLVKPESTAHSHPAHQVHPTRPAPVPSLGRVRRQWKSQKTHAIVLSSSALPSMRQRETERSHTTPPPDPDPEGNCDSRAALARTPVLQPCTRRKEQRN
jgi:hypothetical protein